MAYFKVVNIEANGQNFEFVNTSGNTRNGFFHQTQLTTNGHFVKTKCFYLNRTWERFTYQSVMLKAVSILIEERAEEITKKYKFENNIERLTAKRKEEVKELIKADNSILTYAKVKELLNNNIY